MFVNSRVCDVHAVSDEICGECIVYVMLVHVCILVFGIV